MPVVNKLRELHLGKDLKDLESLYNVETIIKGRKTEHLCATAKKLLDLAVEEQTRGDEEASYVNYMKYLSVVTAVQKRKDLTPSLTDIVGGGKGINGALQKAEVLNASLRSRYKLISDQATVDAALLEQEHDEAEAEVKKRAQKKDQGLSNGLAISGDGVSLSCKQLYEIQNSKNLRVLILDARPVVSFANSHMTYENCISIPEEIVEAGISAAALERNMPAASKILFSQRRLFDQVILLDWDSTEAKFTPGSKLHILQSILLRWDPEVIYKHPPLILKGGYTEWLLTYPMLSTDPRARQASHDALADLLLDDIEYPSFDSDLSFAGSMGSPGYSRPGVDRGSKAAAIQTYDERSKTVTDLLEASAKGGDVSLELEKNRLKAEEEWETLRVSKEKEADDELRQHLQDRQEELMSKILELEESHQKKEAENQLLNKQLEEMKRRESRDSANSAPIPDRSTKMRAHDAEIKNKIEFTKAETIAVAKKREEATNERLRRVELERLKRKQEEAERRKAKQLEQQKIEDSYTVKLNDNPSSALMKRSHSSPNIAQLSDGEDGAAKGKVPEYNRSIKPLSASAKRSELYAARKRNFSPVHGSMGTGLTGLKNLGNSCYMNSIIQCINNTYPILRYFCKDYHHTDINHDSETRGEIAEEMAAVIRALWIGHYRSIACRDLKDTVGQHKREFLGTQQQDSHEFLFYLIDWLHNDLNKRNSKTKLPAEKMREDLSESDKQWFEFERCNLSIFKELFFGQQKSTVQCIRCGNESVTYETFNHLTLPLPSNVTRCSLSECMKLYLSGDRISGWKCTNCKDLREATKKFDICRLPPILVIHFKRFQHDGWSSKIQTYVDFPLNDLDMGVYGASKMQTKEQKPYNLYGVSNHYGTIEGGHYTAYCKNYVLDKWFKFDDLEVRELSPSEVKTGAAYILFYSALPNNNKPSFPIGR